MLTSLEVHQFALIDRLRIEFKPGFNVFTGETGAGKSILIDALGIVLGDRALTDYIRDGTDSCMIQAVFDISDVPAVSSALEELGLDTGEDVLFLRRRIGKNGKSQAFVNDSQVTAKVLSRLGSMLVDIHGQHENQTLLRHDAPLSILHHYVPALNRTLADYKEKFVAYRKGQEELDFWQKKNLHQDEELARLEDELKEIDEARIRVGEDEELRDVVKRLSHQERIMEAMSVAHNLLNGTEEGKGALDMLTEARHSLESVSDYDPELSSYAETLDSSWQTLEDVRQTLADKLSGEEDWHKTLDEAQSRLDLLYHLKKKYGGSLEKVLAYRDAGAQAYARLQHLNETIEKLSKRQQVLAADLEKQAMVLTSERKAAADKFCQELLPHLRDLAMPHGRVELSFHRLSACGPSGQDEVEFLFSANEGIELQPLGKIASGGELSRFALAVKTVLLKKFGVPTMIFDEIDTGVGGVTAQKMAEKMALIATERQVLCITHLAQIACFADQHLYIEKASHDGTTTSKVTALDQEGRVTEIMRMTSGTQQTRSARENAREMLAMADHMKATMVRSDRNENHT
jgi:DNA repair protein RecN (Recombination protein N)